MSLRLNGKITKALNFAKRALICYIQSRWGKIRMKWISFFAQAPPLLYHEPLFFGWFCWGLVECSTQVFELFPCSWGEMEVMTFYLATELRKLKFCDSSFHLSSERKKENEVAQSCPTLCDLVDCSPSFSSVRGILQARILEWVAIPFSRGSFRPRDQTWVFCIAGGFFTVWGIREAPLPSCSLSLKKKKKPCCFWVIPSLPGNSTAVIAKPCPAWAILGKM